jgi:hypothetical protein
MSALHELISRYGMDVDAHLDRDADIPVLTGPQAQGDIGIRPVQPRQEGGSRFRRLRIGSGRRATAVTPIPAGGVLVASGQEGHEHRLLPGPARFDLVRPFRGSLLIGILTVPAGCEAYLAHDQHGFLGIGPGTYEVGSQREWTPESWQPVED